MSRFASFRPSRSLSPTLEYVRFDSFSLFLALHLRSLWTGPRWVRKETEAARQVSSHFLFLSFTVISPSYSAPFFQPYYIADHLDGRLSIHQGPTSPLPIDRLCPRRENSRGVDLLPSPDTCLASVLFHRSEELTILSISQFSRAHMIFLKEPASAKSIIQRSTWVRVIMFHLFFFNFKTGT